MKNFIFFTILVVGCSFGALSEKITLVYSDWHLVEPVWERSLKEAVAEFQALYPNIEVVFDYVSLAEKTTKYATAMQGGKGPDVVHLQAHAEFYAFMSRGYLLNITPYVNQEGPEFIKPWSPDVLALCQKDGQFYGLPGDLDAMLLVYNAKLFEEAGLDPDRPPKTWDEFISYATKLTQDSDGDGVIDRWGFAFPGSISPSFQLRFMPFLYSFGADILTSDYKCCALNSPNAKEAMQFVGDLVTKYKVMSPAVSGYGAGDCRNLMAFEKVAMLIEGPWTLSIIQGINPSVNWRDNLRVAPVPVKNGHEGPRTTAELTIWAVNANTKHPYEAWLLVKFLTSKEMQEKFWRDNYVIPSRLDVSGGNGFEPYQPLAADTGWSLVFAQELPFVRIVPQLEEWPEIIEVVNVAMQQAWTQQKPALQALEEAYTMINRILVAYRLPGEKCPQFK
ncbi:MAG: sugar ABC transporter substrate-binding protein [Candidatus Bathyarchaeia archaeon]